MHETFTSALGKLATAREVHFCVHCLITRAQPWDYIDRCALTRVRNEITGQ